MKLDYFLNKIVTVEIDRPKGTLHDGTVYPVNYGFIPGVQAEDGEDVDVYILGEDNTLKRVHIICAELLHLFSGRVMKLN